MHITSYTRREDLYKKTQLTLACLALSEALNNQAPTFLTDLLISYTPSRSLSLVFQKLFEAGYLVQSVAKNYRSIGVQVEFCR